MNERFEEKLLREEKAETIADFLDRIGAYEYVQKLKEGSKTEREGFKFEEFRDFVIRINGILRDIPIKDRRIDGETVYVGGFADDFLMPRHEDKEDILKDAYESLGDIKSGDEAYLLSAVVNAIHLFADGNGRTSRVLFTLLKAGSKEEFAKSLDLAVGVDGRYDTPDISPGLIAVDVEKNVLIRHGIKFKDDGGFSPIFPENFGRLFASIEQPTKPKALEFMSLRKKDQVYCFISVYEYLNEKGILSKVLVNIPSGLTISPLKMEQELDDNDWDEIINRYYGLKKEHVEVIINSFVDPGDYKNVDETMNLRDYFLSEIERRLEENQKTN